MKNKCTTNMARYKEYGYDIQNGKAIIPEWETEIKEEAFKYCKELTSVEFPLWIKKIGKEAFWGCWNLTEITLPEWVEEIGEGAFSCCSTLTSISIPRACKVGKYAFYDCPKVKIIRYGPTSFWKRISLIFKRP